MNPKNIHEKKHIFRNLKVKLHNITIKKISKVRVKRPTKGNKIRETADFSSATMTSRRHLQGAGVREYQTEFHSNIKAQEEYMWTNENLKSLHQKIFTIRTPKIHIWKRRKLITEGRSKMQWRMENRNLGKQMGKYVHILIL